MYSASLNPLYQLWLSMTGWPELCNVISNATHIKTIILTKIQNANSRVLIRFFFIWPSDIYFYYLIWPIFKHGLDIIKKNILTKFRLAQNKNAASGFWTIFSFNDLVSDPILPIFELDLDWIQKNILTKFQADEAKNAGSRVLPRFPSIWRNDLLFDQA